MAIAGATALNTPNLGLARLLRRLGGSDVACALLAETQHAPAVCAATALLAAVAPNDGSGGGFRLRQPRGAAGRAEAEAGGAGGGAKAKAAAGSAGGGAAAAAADDARGELPLLSLLELLASAEDELLSGGVRCSQLHGAPPCTAALVSGSAAILRYIDCLASGRGPPCLGDGDGEAAMPAHAPLLARATAEVCNYEAVRRVGRCGEALRRRALLSRPLARALRLSPLPFAAVRRAPSCLARARAR